MNRFEATNRSSDVVAADRAEIWAVLTDPKLLAKLTPMVQRIDDLGDRRWRWQLFGISAVGMRFAPCFTERMLFTDPERIDFDHAPPAGSHERSGAEGIYELAEVEGGTRVSIRLTVHVDLPLPSLSRSTVERVMATTMQRTGERFATNLRQHLGIDARR